MDPQLLSGSGERSVSDHAQVIEEGEGSRAGDKLTCRLAGRLGEVEEMPTDAWLPPSKQELPVSFEISQWSACNN